MKHTVLMMLLISAGLLFAAKNSYVTAVENDLAVYEKHNMKPEMKPLFRVSKGEKLEVLKTKSDYYRIRTSSEKIGWVEKRGVTVLSEMGDFVPGVVHGGVNDGSPAVVTDVSEAPVTDAIVPDRSFKDNLKKNVSKESVGVQK